jgi:hypothetical protein
MIMANRIELITDFLIKNKKVLSISGIEKKSGVYGRYWAKFMCGAVRKQWADESTGGAGSPATTLKVLSDLKIDLEKLLSQSNFKH